MYQILYQVSSIGGGSLALESHNFAHWGHNLLQKYWWGPTSPTGGDLPDLTVQNFSIECNPISKGLCNFQHLSEKSTINKNGVEKIQSKFCCRKNSVEIFLSKQFYFCQKKSTIERKLCRKNSVEIFPAKQF